jgi:hypothetical protein
MRALLMAIGCFAQCAALAADMPSEIAKAFANVNTAPNDQAEWQAREQLATLSSKFPETFSSIILSEPDAKKRWLAVYAVRKAGHDKCDKALTTVFNNPKEPQDLRIQVMMCFMEASELTKDRLRPFLPGIHLLLTERPRPVDLRRAIALSGYLGDGSSVPLLIPLLDDKKVHSYTVEDSGKQIPNSISKTAHEALQKITGRNEIPADRKTWEQLK